MFAVIFLEQWLKEEHHITSMIGIVASVICLIIFGLNSFMVPTMAVIIFSVKRKIPEFVNYIGRYLPSTVFGILVIYCLKDVQFLQGNYGISEMISILVTTTLYVWKRNMLISIPGGTICYMVLIQLVF